jgi:hypothetical protein
MPAVGLAQADAADLISYLATETARLEQDKGPAMPEHADHQQRTVRLRIWL